jgi:D-xylose transport system ATP-binding protein
VPLTPTPPLLEMRGISKRFGSVVALAGVDFCVGAGEVVALVGDNGAGKSTLVKVITGIHPHDAGTVAIGGAPIRLGTPQRAAEAGIAAVYQDLALCDNLNVISNLFLGRELCRGTVARLLRRVDDLEMEHRAIEVLIRLGVHLPDITATVARLSGGQRQGIAVARAVLFGGRLVVLDEPTAALGVAQTALVLRLIGNLRNEGLGIVLVSHNLTDVFAVADRIEVLRLGRNAGSFTAALVEPEEVVAAITSGSETRRSA